MSHSPTIIAATVLVIGSVLGTQAIAAHQYGTFSLLPAVCQLKDTACAFEAVNCQRPMTAYTLQQVAALRVSAEQLHEAVRCQASPAQISVIFNQVCAYAARADVRFQASHNFRCDPEWSIAWSYVQNDIQAVRCLLQPVTVSPSCAVRVGYRTPHHENAYHAVPGVQTRDFRTPGFQTPGFPGFQPPPQRQPPSRFDGRPEVLPPPPVHQPSSQLGRPLPDTRSVRHDALQSLLLSLLR